MIALVIFSIGWPLSPQDSTHALGNNWPEYQDYGGGPYFHNGIDVMGITVGKPVYAVQRGIVKAWLTIQAEYHWRLAIADTNLSADSVEAWLYAHIDPYLYHKNVGDIVNAGDLIGYLVYWPVYGFDHCHFARIKDIGTTWNFGDWAFIENPLLLISPNADSVKPVFENAYSTFKFALCRNNTSTYLSPASVNGAVDIIARIYDRTGYALAYTEWEKLVPYRITYEIHGPQNMPVRLSYVFRGRLNYEYLIGNVYKDDAVCDSWGDYDYRRYYFIVTNTDGDSLIEANDASYSWNTLTYPNGDYWILVTAYDAAGNYKTDSMRVTVSNTGIEEDETAQYHRDRSAPVANPARRDMLRVAKGARFYDHAGKLIARDRLAHLPAGVYFLVAGGRASDRTDIKKIVVVR